jgi:hypothetical protein
VGSLSLPQSFLRLEFLLARPKGKVSKFHFLFLKIKPKMKQKIAANNHNHFHPVNKTANQIIQRLARHKPIIRMRRFAFPLSGEGSPSDGGSLSCFTLLAMGV